MKSTSFPSILVRLSILVILVGLLTACGSAADDVPNDGVPPEDTPLDSSSDDLQSEADSTGPEFEEAELPADFPEVFPLPEYTKVGSSVPLPGENSFRIFFALPEVSLEEILAFYNLELPDKGWSVDAEGPEVTGYGMWITHPEYEAKLNFIVDEYGVVLDLAIAPLGELEEVPGGAETFGESEDLGAGGGDFPADFPVPSRFSAIDLPSKLAEEGYQLAYNFSDMAELAIVELSTALITGGWEIGEFEFDTMTASYIVPFTSPGGFQGYALITAKPDVAGLDSISGSVIALHAGVKE